MRRNTRPTIDDSLIGPKNLESFDAARLSPKTSTSPAGIVVGSTSPQLVAAVFGFGGIAGTAVEIAKLIFFVAIVLFAISAVIGLLRGRSPL